MSNPTVFGILNTQTIAYAGFAILGIFLLVFIIWGIINLNSSGDLWTLIVGGASGAILLILGYFIIYHIALTSTTIEDNESVIEPMPEQQNIISPVAQITNLHICNNNALPCITEGFTSNDIYIYWEVIGGVGCCNTFGCDYQIFTAFCGTPFQEYRLYDIALDGEVYKWGKVIEWDYECSYNIPWNYLQYINITPGMHEVTIWQKDCIDVVDIVTIYFNLIDSGGGTYAIKQI